MPIHAQLGGGGGGSAPAATGAANVLEVRAIAPPTAGFSVGDIIDVDGEALVLVDDDSDANILRGTAAAGVDDYRGVNRVSGGASNYGAFADPAYHGEVSWYTRGGGGSPSWRVRLPDGPLGGSPPARIYGRVVGADGQTTDLVLNRDRARDGTSLTAYATDDDDPRPEIPVGEDFTATFWTVSWDGTDLDVHDVERWEKYHLVAGPDVPPTRAQIYHLVKSILRAGDGANVTPDDAADTLTVAAAAAGIAATKVQTAGAANVVIDTPAMDAWSAWSTVVTAAAATAAGIALVKAQLHATLTATPSPPAGTLVALDGGGDRVHSDYRIVRRRDGADTVIEGEISYQPRNAANAAGATYVAATQGADAALSWDDECRPDDVYRIEARHIAQGGAANPPAQRRLTYAAAEQMISVVTLAAAAGAGRGQGRQSPGADGFSRGPDAPDSPATGDVWSDTTSHRLRRRTSGGAWEDYATEDYADAGDAVNFAALNGLASSLVRRARYARAWIRAADRAAALAGVAAARWTNAGAGAAPTGAHWEIGDVPAGSDPLWELTALVSPTPGSSTSWSFGTWAALQVTAVNTQYSVDGSTLWHSVRVGADRYERHRAVGGAWGPAIPLDTADEVVWQTLLSQVVVEDSTRWLPGVTWTLPAPVNFAVLDFMRIRLQTERSSDNHPILGSDVVLRPANLMVAHDHAQRASNSLANIPAHLTWSLRLTPAGLGLVLGRPAMPAGATGDGESAGLQLMWYRPSGLGSAQDAEYLRVLYVANLGVRHVLTVEAI